MMQGRWWVVFAWGVVDRPKPAARRGSARLIAGGWAAEWRGDVTRPGGAGAQKSGNGDLTQRREGAEAQRGNRFLNWISQA